ncbi:3-deoxy-D-manno-octulosonic acid kinase [Desulfurivibrio alkaliphilus]|uniref:3-deoxy-D-manno-octulosonic acid kinase n=1 Tax=Desulfurivibrio alkaliphilus (strain DSM 19089 / UNIQEM U267 / AHT2) TaxID=589865 RepID=D6Z2M2_DESAT|nr:3-deoxy-D-manno-octulosonic acid kinase [Desulfurivibrio alkaliphilus]ADH85797.1 Mn2+dependent serine/threonine protein kinase [Desulfurivibrio alkaliphilus AHT 2]
MTDIRPSTAYVGKQKIIYDASLFAAPPRRLFDSRYLGTAGLITGEAVGRGQAWFFRYEKLDLVLRHFRRGGIMEKLLVDRYPGGSDPEKTRSWREWRLLAKLYRQGLPVPRPVAARVDGGPLVYRADLITQRIPDARSLADRLAAGKLEVIDWGRIGKVIARFHHLGVWHPDLNARNVLLDRQGGVFLVDFDQGRLKAGLGAQQNLKRLLRSLNKIKNSQSPFYFEETDWPLLLAGYHSHPAPECT